MKAKETRMIKIRAVAKIDAVISRELHLCLVNRFPLCRSPISNNLLARTSFGLLATCWRGGVRSMRASFLLDSKNRQPLEYFSENLTKHGTCCPDSL